MPIILKASAKGNQGQHFYSICMLTSVSDANNEKKRKKMLTVHQSFLFKVVLKNMGLNVFRSKSRPVSCLDGP